MVHCRAPNKLKLRRADVMRVLGHVRQRERDVADREDAATEREHDVPIINDELLGLAADASETATRATRLAAMQLQAEHLERSRHLLAESQKRTLSSTLCSSHPLCAARSQKAHGMRAHCALWQWTVSCACRAWPRPWAVSRPTSCGAR